MRRELHPKVSAGIFGLENGFLGNETI